MDLMLPARDGVKLAATRFDATPPFRGALLLNGGTGIPRQFYARLRQPISRAAASPC